MNVPSHAATQVWRAVLLMLASACMFGCMAIVIRLASAQLHPFEIAFFRTLFGLVFALPLVLRHGSGLLKTSKLSLYFFRSIIGIVSMFCGFWAIANLPLAQAVSLSYSTPLFVTIGAVLVLGEVVRARRWTAVALGFVGVVCILRPGSEFSPGVLVALLAAVLSAAVAISIKFLSRTEKPDAIVLYSTMLWVPLSLLPALWVWETPQGITWLWIVLAGFFGTAGHMCWARALQLGDASMLTPISFLQVPLVAAAGFLLFDESLDVWIGVGAAIIFLANAYIAHREAQLARRTVTDPDIAQESPSAR